MTLFVTLVSLTLGYKHPILHLVLLIIHRKFYVSQTEGTYKLLTGTWQLVQYMAVGAVHGSWCSTTNGLVVLLLLLLLLLVVVVVVVVVVFTLIEVFPCFLLSSKANARVNSQRRGTYRTLPH